MNCADPEEMTAAIYELVISGYKLPADPDSKPEKTVLNAARFESLFEAFVYMQWWLGQHIPLEENEKMFSQIEYLLLCTGTVGILTEPGSPAWTMTVKEFPELEKFDKIEARFTEAAYHPRGWLVPAKSRKEFLAEKTCASES